MLTRADVERIIENVLSQLTLEVDRPDWTNPNDRIIVLKLGDRIITQTTFNVVQKDEYED